MINKTVEMLQKDYFIKQFNNDHLQNKCWYFETRIKIEYSHVNLLKEAMCFEEYEDVVENIRFVQLANGSNSKKY